MTEQIRKGLGLVAADEKMPFHRPQTCKGSKGTDIPNSALPILITKSNIWLIKPLFFLKPNLQTQLYININHSHSS